MDFRLLRDTVEVSDSLLSKHLAALENAGYAEISKGRLGRRTQTWIRLTAAGTIAFDKYQQVLQRIIQAGSVDADSGTGTESS
jgi:DNA-binding MarR family transcriptional regulator